MPATSRWDSADRAAGRRACSPSPRSEPLTPLQLAASMWVATTDPSALADEPQIRLEAAAWSELEGRAAGFARPIDPARRATSRSASRGAAVQQRRQAQGPAGRRRRPPGRPLKSVADRRERVDLAVRGDPVPPAADDEEISAARRATSARREDRPVEGCRSSSGLLARRRVPVQSLTRSRATAEHAAMAEHATPTRSAARPSTRSTAAGSSAAWPPRRGRRSPPNMTGLDVLKSPALAGELKKQQKRVILLWLAGGASQLETWDPSRGARPAGRSGRSRPSCPASTSPS